MAGFTIANPDAARADARPEGLRDAALPRLQPDDFVCAELDILGGSAGASADGFARASDTLNDFSEVGDSQMGVIVARSS